MHTDDVKKLDAILKLDEEQFVTLQFKTAERLGDTARAIKHSIRLKVLFGWPESARSISDQAGSGWDRSGPN